PPKSSSPSPLLPRAPACDWSTAAFRPARKKSTPRAGSTSSPGSPPPPPGRTPAPTRGTRTTPPARNPATTPSCPLPGWRSCPGCTVVRDPPCLTDGRRSPGGRFPVPDCRHRGRAAGASGNDRGAGGCGGGVLGEGEDVPGDIGAGDGLHPEPVAGPDAAGKGAVGELDGAQRVPVELAGGELFLHCAQVLANAAEVGDGHGAKEAEQQPRPGAHDGISWSHAGRADADQPGCRGGVPQRGDEGAGQPQG